MTTQLKNTTAQCAVDTLQEIVERQDLLDQRTCEQPSMIEPLLSVKDLANWLGIGVRTIDKLVAKNEAPPFVKIIRQRKWRPADVRAWLQELADK